MLNSAGVHEGLLIRCMKCFTLVSGRVLREVVCSSNFPPSR